MYGNVFSIKVVKSIVHVESLLFWAVSISTPAISASDASRGAGMIANVCLTNTGIVKLYNCYLLKFTPQINIGKYIIETSLH